MSKDQIHELADKIIADYKEQYDFSTGAESHMHDCITSDLEEFAQLEKAQEPAGFQVRSFYTKNEWTGNHKFETTQEVEESNGEWRYVYISPPEVAELKPEIERLVALNDKLRANEQKLIDDKFELQKQITTLRKQVNSYKTLVWAQEQLQLAAAEDKRTVESMTGDNTGLAQCNSILTDENDALQKQVQDLISQNKDYLERLLNVRGSYEAANKANEQAHVALAESQHKVTDLEKQVQALQA